MRLYYTDGTERQVLLELFTPDDPDLAAAGVMRVGPKSKIKLTLPKVPKGRYVKSTSHGMVTYTWQEDES